MLTAELIRPHTKNNLVMVTWANNHYYDFVKNWVYNLNKIGVRLLPTQTRRASGDSGKKPINNKNGTSLRDGSSTLHTRLPPGGVPGWWVCPYAQPACPHPGGTPAAPAKQPSTDLLDVALTNDLPSDTLGSASLSHTARATPRHTTHHR